MDLNDIEVLLQKAPSPQPPKGLLEKLQADMHCPQLRPEMPLTWSVGLFWWARRWLPATTVVLLVAATGVLAMQSVTISRLQQENQRLKAASTAPPPSTSGKDEPSELESLRKDGAEVQRLRREVAGLRAQGLRLAELRAENQRLRLQAGLNAGIPGVESGMNSKGESFKCVNNLKQIGLAARIYAMDHQDLYPRTFLEMTNELTTPKILHCPSDLEKPELSDWSEFTLDSSSYQSSLAPNLSPDQPSIMVRCPIHNHVCLSDGSIHQDIVGNHIQTFTRDGREYLVLPSAPTNAPSFQ